jgi:hypothetical protein
MDRSNLGRWHRRARLGVATIGIVIAMTALAACDSDGGGSGAASTATPATPATTAPPTTERLTGNLRITGDRPLSLPAVTGECRLPANGLPKAFVVTNPALGTNGYIAAFGPTTVPGRAPIPPNVKIYANGVGMLSPASGTGMTVAPDQRSVSIDADISGGTGNSRNGALVTTAFLRGHITGELRCR